MAVCCMGLIKQLGTNSSVRKSKGKIQTFTAAAFSNFQNVLSLNWTANKSHHSHQVKISPYIAKLLPKTRRAGKSQLAKVVTFHWKEGFCFQNANSDNFTWYFLLKNYLSIFLGGTNGTEKLTSDQQGKINQIWQQMMSMVFNEDEPGSHFIDKGKSLGQNLLSLSFQYRDPQY